MTYTLLILGATAAGSVIAVEILDRAATHLLDVFGAGWTRLANSLKGRR